MGGGGSTTVDLEKQAQVIAPELQLAVVGPGDNGDALSAVNLATLMAMVEAGDLTPVVDMTLPLDRIAEAHRRVDSGHKVGSIVVTC